MKAAKETVEVNLPELLERKREVLGEEDYQKLKKGLWALSYLTCKDAARLCPAMRDPQTIEEIFSL